MYVIYGLVNKDNQVYYVGHTCDIKGRISQHKSCCYNQNDHYYLPVYKFIRDNNLEINYIVLEENISEEDKYKKEREWYEKYENLTNKCVPGRTTKEYRDDNKEKIIEYKKEYYVINKEKLSEQRKEYYEEHKEQIIKYIKEWGLCNPEKVKENKKRYRENNKEKVKEIQKRYSENNKEKIKEYSEKNKDKRKEWSNQPWTCGVCNKTITLTNKARHLKLHNKN